jgi:hypothetical protein
MRLLSPAACTAALALAGCASTPPPHWAQGGAPLVLGGATWTTSDGTPIELRPDGKVLVDGSVAVILDRAGRIYDSDSEPAAILLADGNIVGSDGAHLGRIGMTNAAPPGGGAAWLTVFPDGTVLHFDPDGERSHDGAWRGCGGKALRTCTLVTHLVTLERVAAASHGSVFLGVGIGVWR